MPPAQPGKPAEPAVQRKPLAPEFHGDRCMVGIWQNIAPRPHFAAEIRENLPVIRAGRKKVDVVARAEVFDKIESRTHGSRGSEDFRMGNHSQASAQHQIRHTHAGGRGQFLLQPTADFGMILVVLSMGGNEDVDVQKYHRPSITSSKALDEAKSTPGCRPSPR